MLLGGLNPQQNNCNNCVEGWNYIVVGASNRPDDPRVNGRTLWVYSHLTNAQYQNRVQFAVCSSDGQYIFHRSQQDGTWSNWHEVSLDIPLFYKNYNDLASLVTALGSNGLMPLLGESRSLSDFNDFPQGFNFIAKSQEDISNAPFTDRELRGWVLTLIGGSSGQYSLQYYGDTQVPDRHYVRTAIYDGTWLAWRKISTTQL